MSREYVQKNQRALSYLAIIAKKIRLETLIYIGITLCSCKVLTCKRKEKIFLL